MSLPFQIRKSEKSDKKNVLRFYKSQQYHARFIGLDYCYLLINKNAIIGSVIISQITPENAQYFLHALVIDSRYKNQGLASSLITFASTMHSPIICFAHEQLSPLYLANQFTHLALNQVDNQLTEQISIRFNTYRKKQPNLNVFIYQRNSDKNDE